AGVETMTKRNCLTTALLAACILFGPVALGLAQEPATPDTTAAPAPDPNTPANLRVGLDTLWVMITGFLVFFMNLGFGCVEAGFARAKNCVNILSKNFIVFAVSTLGFWFLGWGLMFGNGTPYYGQEGLLMVSGEASNGDMDNSPATLTDYK